MAVATASPRAAAGMTTGRRVLVGTNVAAMIAIAVTIVVVAQALAFKLRWRADMTSSGVNSLSDGTERLLRGLDKNIRLTSLYFETDREEKDQHRYRHTVGDLLNLYEATNRGKVRAAWTNPLKDHEDFQRLLTRLREKSAFKDELDSHKARVEHFTQDLDVKLRALVRAELEEAGKLGGASIGASGAPNAIARVEDALRQLTEILEENRKRIDAMAAPENPQYSEAINDLRTFYGTLSKTFKNITKFGAEEAQRNPGLSPDQSRFLREAGMRYAGLVADIEGETTKLQDIKPPKFDALADQLTTTGNAILVETDEDARVVDFSSVWPPMDPNNFRAGFKQRAFKGEEKLTSAILRATHKEQTAVVFVRYGGQPLFMGGMMPGMGQAAYPRVKQQLEDANFVVEEWDVKAKETPPEITPTPTRVIYVVLNPQQEQRNPMMQQQPPEQQFGEGQRQAILKAIGDKSRALFIAGWQPGPFGAMASTYEFGDYLSKEWGISVDATALLIETVSFETGKYAVGRRDFHLMREIRVGDHPIVTGALARELGLPACAPLQIAQPAPSGVEISKLVHLPAKDGIWGVKNLQAYQEQFNTRQYLTKEAGDLVGPYDLAVAATKGDAKIVVVSSAEFAEDNVAFAPEMSIGAEGIMIRSRNPGNVSLLINSLHWLNDKTEFMDIGKPIEAAVLQIPSETTVKAVQGLTIVIWPLLAILGGGVTWWIRRK